MPPTDWYDDDADQEDDFESSITEYDITSSPNDFNIKTIFDFVESGVVKIPGFQRHYVWDIKRASKLIESIIIGIPIPQIFLFEKNRNNFLVIDGQQRLMSIFYFMKRRFPRKEKRPELRAIFDAEGAIPEQILHDNTYFTEFRLKLPENLPNKRNKLNKLNYSTLDEYRTTFELRTIRNVIIKQNFPDDDSAVYEIFNRLNSGGMNLGTQEIRSSLYHCPFYSLLYKLNTHARWRRLLGVESADLHMKDIEFLLRGFALLIDGSTYTPSMAKFLNSFSKNCQNLSNEKLDYLERLFVSLLDCWANLPEKAFYGKGGKFTISIYDAVFAAVCSGAFERQSLDIAKIDINGLEKLKQDREFSEASQSQTSSKKNVQMRLERAKAILIDGAM